MLRGIFHFSFTVSDIERSCDWYTNVLGFELVHRQRQDNDYTRALVGLDSAVLEVAQFRIPGIVPEFSTHILELVEYRIPTPRRIDLQTQNVGVAHLCVVVDSIDDEHARLAAAGVTFVNPPVVITEGVNRGGKACYFRDPDGITLELHEPPPR